MSITNSTPNDQPTGRLNAEEWDAEATPLPYPSIFDRPVAPSKLDPVLLEAGPLSFVRLNGDGSLTPLGLGQPL